MNLKSSQSIISLMMIGLLIGSCGPDAPKEYKEVIYEKPEINPDPPATFHSPEESMSKIMLPEGYHLELVASEPMINEPVEISWDANGNMYVVQMLTYMQNIDGNEENEPWSRIMLLRDTDNDGVMDESSVFIDSLLLPRFALPLDNRLLVMETYDRHLWSYRDTDGDFVADVKVKLVDDPSRDNRNLEHQPANLMWNIDNWMYLTRDNFRYRYTDGKIEVDTLLDPTPGQWGLTQDETGRMFFSLAGSEVAANGFQIHPIYGRLEMEDKWEEGFEQPWPIIGTPDVQGGLGRLRDDNTLNKFTAVAGQTIYLGDNLPASMYGDLFIPEPVGRLIRRAKVDNVDGKVVLRNPYAADSTEFIASTDPNFRPVNMQTGPDGNLYIVDMYRGIIQEGNWVREGSFLRPVVERKGLDKNVGKGRIYRLVHDDIERGTPESIGDKSPAELIPYLSHKNGWYRMTAQKLIVLSQDKSVVSQLKDILKDNEPMFDFLKDGRDYGIERLHAFWTLEGLDELDKLSILTALNDPDPRVREAGLKKSDEYIKRNDAEILEKVKTLANDPDGNVRVQLLLSLRATKNKEVKDPIINKVMNDYPDNNLIALLGEESLKDAPPMVDMLKQKYILDRNRESIIRGYEIYNGLCVTCHGPDGKGMGETAPPLVGSPRVAEDAAFLKILMNGLTGPIDGKEYTGLMVGMKANENRWITDVANYVRIHLNDGEGIGFREAFAARSMYGERDKYWTIPELERTKGDLDNFEFPRRGR